MAGLCDRNNCRQVATAAAAVDLRNQVLWIGDLGDGRAAMILCDRCATTLRPPRGWERRDVRELGPRLVVVPPAVDDTPVAPLRPAPPTARSRLLA